MHHLETDGASGLWPANQINRVEKSTNSISYDTCSYPPGFGPCNSSGHVHRSEPSHVESPQTMSLLLILTNSQNMEASRSKARNEDDLLVRLAGRKLQRKKCLGVVETKKEVVENSLVRKIWGGMTDFGGDFVESDISAGGLLALWKEDFFYCER
ncbi:hypothetical protein PIB30_065042, partial [Stylosanthes scabra]|nr:hypothetical protein [Stylosanthes scabra]